MFFVYETDIFYKNAHLLSKHEKFADAKIECDNLFRTQSINNRKLPYEERENYLYVVSNKLIPDGCKIPQQNKIY